MLSDIELRAYLRGDIGDPKDPFVITPLISPGIPGAAAGDDGEAIQGCAVDLRLGTWFEMPRVHGRAAHGVIGDDSEDEDGERPFKTIFVPFMRPFYLHPRNFVLAVTLEWIRMPSDLAGVVTGKSKWGRRGLNVATATLVHPHFVGCLTLELANVGEHPIALRPGMPICQLAVQRLSSSASMSLSGSPLIGHRKAVHTTISPDRRAVALGREP